MVSVVDIRDEDGLTAHQVKRLDHDPLLLGNELPHLVQRTTDQGRRGAIGKPGQDRLFVGVAQALRSIDDEGALVFGSLEYVGCGNVLHIERWSLAHQDGRTRANRQIAKRFRHVVRLILTAAAAYPQFESEIAAKRAAEVLAKVASEIVGLRSTFESHHPGRPRVSRQDIVQRSMALLETQDLEPVFVAELAAAAGVSERTLRSAFVEYFGVGPIRYLQLRQLHLIHRALRAADPEADSVTAVLARYGEWEFGRFASRYRRLFGEPPSETLRRTRR